MQKASQTSKKSRILAVALAVSLAAAMAISGGTLSYLSDATETDVVNTFEPNYVDVDLNETTGEDYNIIPGTSEEKDPTVTVKTTVDTYVFVTVKDTTDGLVTWEVAEGWTKLDVTTEDNTTVYYRLIDESSELAKDEYGNQINDTYKYAILKGDSVSYSAGLTNEDMREEGEDGTQTLKKDLELTFSAFAIQKNAFASPISAYYGNGIIVDETTNLADVLEAAKEEGSEAVTLTMSDGISIEETLAVEAMDVLIDLNGQELANSVVEGRPFQLSNGASVTVVGGESGTVTDSQGASYGVFELLANADASLNLEGGTYKLDTDDGAIVRLRSGTTADIVLNDVNAETNNRIVATNSYNSGSLTVNGGNYTTTNETDVPAFFIGIQNALFDGTKITTENVPCVEVTGTGTTNGIGNAVFRNCEFTVKKENTQSHLATAVAVEYGASATIDSGTYTAPYAAYIYNSGGSLTINGGTFTGTKAALRADKGTIIVNGGEFKGDITIAKDATLTIYGGTFSADPTDYVAEGYSATQNGDVWTVTPNTDNG